LGCSCPKNSLHQACRGSKNKANCKSNELPDFFSISPYLESQATHQAITPDKQPMISISVKSEIAMRVACN
jgi:hypothetical protein